MSGFQFDEGNMPTRRVGMEEKKGLTQKLVDKGIAKDYAQAEKMLIGVAIVALLLTGFIIMSRGSSNDTPADSYMPAEEGIYDEDM